MKKDDRWIQRVIRHPGRVQKYVLKKMGAKGFTSKGTIKAEALAEAKRIARKNHDVGMEDAITLAQRLRKFGGGRR